MRNIKLACDCMCMHCAQYAQVYDMRINGLEINQISIEATFQFFLVKCQ